MLQYQHIKVDLKPQIDFTSVCSGEKPSCLGLLGKTPQKTHHAFDLIFFLFHLNRLFRSYSQVYFMLFYKKPVPGVRWHRLLIFQLIVCKPQTD